MNPRFLIATLSTTLCVACAVGLSGCAGAHEIIASGEQCTSCHDEKSTYEVSAPKDAVDCGTQLTVETSAPTVVIAKPIFISEDGSSYVPQRASQANVKDGAATLTLEEGTWAICAADGDKVSASKIVQVSASGSAATIKL